MVNRGLSNGGKLSLARNNDGGGWGGGGRGGNGCVYLRGDTAHFHEKVLSEVVFGEFHPTARAPSQNGGHGEEKIKN